MAAEDENVVVGLNIQGYTFNLRGKNSDMPLYKETESRLNSRIARLHNQMPQATNDQLAFMTAIMSTFDLIQQEQRFKTEETVPAGTEKRIRALAGRLEALAGSSAAPESDAVQSSDAPQAEAPAAPAPEAPAGSVQAAVPPAEPYV